MKALKLEKENTAPLISLTDFVDFVVKSGRPKLTVVKQIKSRDQYATFEDFWRRLRTAIVEYHKNGHSDKSEFDDIIDTLNPNDSPKQTAYPIAIKAYKKFLGRKKLAWIDPPRNVWTAGGINVSVNPEIGLEINGQKTLIKLYFKKEKLIKAKADLILALMQEGLPDLEKGTHVAILDVREAKLFEATKPQTSLLPLLYGEAVNFATIWRELTSKVSPPDEGERKLGAA